MMHQNDTVAAIATPLGQGGIGIVRMSGPDSLAIASRIFRPGRGSIAGIRNFSLRHGHVADPQTGRIIDEALLSVMRAPRSYTREDVVEINCHGGMASLRAILALVLREGCRLAGPGEFTKRAFLNGRIDLAEAEAVMDIIAARTEESRRIAAAQLQGGLGEELDRIRGLLVDLASLAEAHIDFPEEEIDPGTDAEILSRLARAADAITRLAATFDEARFFREGLSIAIVGRPNVGKSSLLNRLLLKSRAIVTDTPGTTRDVIEEELQIRGLPLRIMDTAGIRQGGEEVEQEGIRRSVSAIQDADFVLVVLDGSMPLSREDWDILDLTQQRKGIVAVNKSDLPLKISLENLREAGREYLQISARSGAGIEELKSAVFETMIGHWPEDREGVVVANIRHRDALLRASDALGRGQGQLTTRQPLELFVIELREAIDAIAEITGAVTTDEILDRIFSTFCIGK